MKKLMTLALAFAALVSCSKEENEGIDPNAPVEIKLNAGIEATSRAAISPTLTEDLNVSFARATDAATADWTTATALSAQITSSNKINFNESQYYNFDATLKSHLIGYHTGNATDITLANGKIGFTINGTQDIMATSGMSGNKTSKFGTFSFNHLLSQLVITVKSATGIAANDINTAFGSITKIEILEQPTALELTLGTTPIIAEATDPKSTAITITGTKQAITATEVQFGSEIMVFSNSDLGKTATPIKLKIYTEKFSEGKEISATIAAGASGLEQSKKHTITLTFSLSNIEPEASITAWGDATNNGAGTVE